MDSHLQKKKPAKYFFQQNCLCLSKLLYISPVFKGNSMVLIPRWWDEGRGGFRERQREVSKRDISLFCYSLIPPFSFLGGAALFLGNRERRGIHPMPPPGGGIRGESLSAHPLFPFPLLSEIDEAKDCSFVHDGIKGVNYRSSKRRRRGV